MINLSGGAANDHVLSFSFEPLIVALMVILGPQLEGDPVEEWLMEKLPLFLLMIRIKGERFFHTGDSSMSLRGQSFTEP